MGRSAPYFVRTLSLNKGSVGDAGKFALRAVDPTLSIEGDHDMPKTDKTDSPQKADRAVTCWMTEHEFIELGRECEEMIRNVPGARLSRSSFMTELFRRHLMNKTKGKQES